VRPRPVSEAAVVGGPLLVVALAAVLGPVDERQRLLPDRILRVPRRALESLEDDVDVRQVGPFAAAVADAAVVRMVRLVALFLVDLMMDEELLAGRDHGRVLRIL